MRAFAHPTIVALLSALLCSPAFAQRVIPAIDDTQRAELLPDPFDDSPSFRGDTKIVGGELAGRGAWPWQVAVYRRAMKDGKPLGAGYLFCGGSLISPKWVLTAAHCFEGDRTGRYDRAAPSDLIVVEGTNVLTPSMFGGGKENGRKLRVSRILVHEQWSARSMENDITLLELASPATSRPIALASAAASPRAGESKSVGVEAAGVLATVTGWGHLGFDDPTVPTGLMQVQLPLVSLEECQKAYDNRGGVIDYRTVCAGLREGGKDSCSGDSGGPLVVRNRDGGFLQVGIVSWGRRCGMANFFGVYTRVSAFNDWMHAKTGLAALRQPPAAQPPSAARPTPPSGQPPARPAASAPVVPQPGDRALLIGLDQYENPKLNLRGSVNDARNMQQLLIDVFHYRPEQIRMLTDAQATRANILKAFDEWLIRDSAPGARVFFFYSGHGAQVPDLNGDEEDGLDETLVPYDTRVEVRGNNKVLVNQVIDDEIDERLKRIADRKVTFVVDACHSGTITRGADPMQPEGVKCVCAVLDDYEPRDMIVTSTRSSAPAAPKQGFVERRDNVVAWAAVNDGQLALVDTEQQEAASVFTRRFVQGIRKAASGSGMSHASLLDHVRKESEAYCGRHRKECAAGLSPQLEARRDALAADVVTGAAPARPQDVPESVLAHDNAAGLTVDIVQGSELRIGQTANFRVQAHATGYLVLLDVTPDGKVTQIFPNKQWFSTANGQMPISNQVPAEKALLVPDPDNPYSRLRFEVDPPAGEGRLIAILSRDPIDSVQVPQWPQEYGADAGADFVAQIAEELLREPVIAGKVKKREWSVVQKAYRINP